MSEDLKDDRPPIVTATAWCGGKAELRIYARGGGAQTIALPLTIDLTPAERLRLAQVMIDGLPVKR